jgi:hypothetical protein
MSDLINDLQYKLQLINRAIDTLAHNGKRLAKAEQEYRIGLAKKILELRESGIPVTIISDLARGDRQIAELKFQRDTSEAVYNANQEAINGWKLEVRMLESQISREWGRGD